jgi:hypothetical protein
MSLRSLFTNKLTVGLARNFRNVFVGPDWNAFHRDRMYRQLMMEVLEAMPISSFVETGTWMGDSTQAVALRHKQLPIFTTEVVETTYQTAKRVLSKYPNIQQDLGSSDEVVARLIEEKKVGDFPFFYLDAHWQTYWPLRAELKHISNARLKAAIVIDDFEVPGRPDFGFDIDGGGELTEGLKCNLDYIRPSLGGENTYRALFPKYGHEEAYGHLGRKMELRGHIALFQNCDAEFESFKNGEFEKKNYSEHAV